MNAKPTVEIVFAMLAAQGVISIEQAERLVRDVSIELGGTPLEEVSMRDVYKNLKPICDLWAKEDAHAA